MGVLRRNRIALGALALVGVLALLAGPGSGGAGGETPGTPSSSGTAGRRLKAISVYPASRALVLEPAPAGLRDADEAARLLECYAETRVRVEAIPPVWGVTVELLDFEGPGGPVPHDRMLVRFGGKQGAFVPLSGPVPFVTGDYRLPAKEVPLEILFSPSWTDPPGRYKAQLSLRPFVPDGRGGFGRTAGPADDTGDPGEEIINIDFTRRTTIRVEVSATDLSFAATAGSGDVPANADVQVTVTTNALKWRVECNASPLVYEGHEIPPSRVLWERVDAASHVIGSGDLQDRYVVLQGNAPTAGTTTTLRYRVRILMDDVAGLYRGRFSLVGIIE